MQAGITEFYIANYKSYRQATLPVAPLTLLIGANASGKSNALEAIEFLWWLARGRRLDDIWQAVRDDEVALRGAVADLCHPGERHFELGCTLGAREHVLRISIRASEDGLRIVDEKMWRKVWDQESLLYSIAHVPKGADHNLWVQYDSFARGKKPQVMCTDMQAVFTQLLSPARLQSKHKTSQQAIPQATERLRQALDAMLFLNPLPARMRGYSFPGDSRLKSHGDNLSGVLWNLCVEQKQKDRVLAFVRALPEQDIRDIDFIETPRREVMVRLSESFGQGTQLRDAPLLSDGTLRVLAIAAALLSVPEGTLVIIEEVDNGIHPSRARALLANMDQVAQQRGLRVLLTSHNPAQASALPLHAVPDVVYCFRDPAQGHSRLVRLEDIPDYPALMGQGPLGDLMTRGDLERATKDMRTAEEKQQAALSWLDTFLKEGGAR